MRVRILFIFFFIGASTGITLSQFIVSFKANNEIGCDSLTVQFTDETQASGITKRVWAFGDNTFDSIQQNPTHKYNQKGNYTVKLTVTRVTTDTVVKSETKTDFIKIYSSPSANFSASDSAFSTSFTLLFTSGFDTAGYTYYWKFGDNDTALTSKVIHNYKTAGTYSVFHQVKSNYGCTNDTTKEIKVVSKFSVPNVFTPNGDGINDEFIIKTSGSSTFTFEVFDRWGNLLYSDVASVIRWDGRTLAGTPSLAGTYFYVLTSKDDATHSKQAGFFELVR